MENLDSIDIKLLKLLQGNSRLTTKELATEVGLSISPVYERVKRLENEGYIEKYVALLDPKKLKLSFISFVMVKLNKPSEEGAAEFISTISTIPEVVECCSLMGRFDYYLKIYAPNISFYRKFVLDVLGGIQSVGNVESSIVMSIVKNTTALPLAQIEN